VGGFDESRKNEECNLLNMITCDDFGFFYLERSVFLSMTSLDPYNNRDIRKFTLSLGLLSPSIPSFSGKSKVKKFDQTSV
jgi:hypothetical protein